MEKWVAPGTQLSYRDEQLHEFVKEQQTLEKRDTEKGKLREKPGKRDTEKKEC